MSSHIAPERLPLTPADLAAFERCGITQATVEAAGVFRVENAEGARLVGRRNGSGDYSGIVFPYTLPGEDRPREYRLRLDNPPYELLPDGTRKPQHKYLSPPGARPRLYFVPGATPEWLKDTTLTLIITEGEKKTLALCELAWHALGDAAERPRWLPIGVAGVWNWRGRVGIEPGPNGERRPVKGTIPDFDRVAWKGRRVVIVFDQNVRSNPQVQAARWELTRELRRRGARVLWFDWPPNVPAEVNGIDDLIGCWGRDRVLELLCSESSVREAPHSLTDCERCFERLDEDRYRLDLPSAGVTLEVDRLRWTGGELHGEVLVRCDLPGVRARDGVVAVARLNISSITARRAFTKELQARATIEGLDWALLLEELAQRTLTAQRNCVHAEVLDDAPIPDMRDLFLDLHGFKLLRRHPNMVFAPGGSAKSYLALYWAAQLSKRGERVLYLDAEADIATHRLRLYRLFADSQRTGILYHRLALPLSEELDGLRRLMVDRGVTFLILDSVSCAADGPLEESATATRLYQMIRRFNLGSLLLAHTQKGLEAKDRTPFGSVFFRELARRVWSAAKVDDTGDSFVIKLKCVKSNFGGEGAVFCYRLVFTGRDEDKDARTQIFPVDPAEVEEAAGDLPLHERIAAALRRGALTKEQLAEELDSSPESIRRIINRHKNRFVVLPGGRVGLREWEAGDDN